MSIHKISPAVFEANKKELFLLDVRAEEKFKEFHIDGTDKNIPKNLILDGIQDTKLDLPQGKEVVITCTTGNSAAKCASKLQDQGYRVSVLEGGITAWKQYLQQK